MLFSILVWSRHKQCVLTSLGSSGAWKTLPFCKEFFKNSDNLKDKNIDIIEESQSPCSFSLIRGIDNSVDDVPVPDLFGNGCSKSYNSRDNFSNNKFEKETGRYWSGDENSDVNTSNSDDNENVSLENETEPIFVKVHPFFSRPVGEMCEDKCFNAKEKVKLHLPYKVKDKESDLFNFHVFAKHYKNIRAMTTKICHAISLLWRISFPKPCQSHIVMFLQNACCTG